MKNPFKSNDEQKIDIEDTENLETEVKADEEKNASENKEIESEEEIETDNKTINIDDCYQWSKSSLKCLSAYSSSVSLSAILATSKNPALNSSLVKSSINS